MSKYHPITETNTTGKVYSGMQWYSKAFFIPDRTGNYCTNVIWGHCYISGHLELMRSQVTLVQLCLLTLILGYLALMWLDVPMGMQQWECMIQPFCKNWFQQWNLWSHCRRKCNRQMNKHQWAHAHATAWRTPKNE